MGKAPRSAGPSMKHLVAPSRHLALSNKYDFPFQTRYVEKLPGQFLADSQCEKLPVEICGAGCTFEEGPEKCHDKVRYGTLKQFDGYLVRSSKQ